MTIQKPLLSVSELAAMFNVSEDRIKQQYADNAAVIKKQLDKAIKTGNKVDGYTAEELKANYDRFINLSK
jgi:hypothetical protein